jgi:type IV pilus assembly protein PilB
MCRKPYEPTDEELDNLGIEPEDGLQFFRGAGCPDCFNTGYRGRIAVFEILMINREIRTLMSHKAERDEIEEVLRRPDSGFVSLHQNALRLVREGVTTASEVLRVINETD